MSGTATSLAVEKATVRAALPPGRAAAGSIALRDWFVSLAVHAGVLIAAMPLAASLGEMPMRSAPLQVPIRWVEAPAAPAVVEPDIAVPVPRPEAVPTPAPAERMRPAPRAEVPEPSPTTVPTPKPVTKPTPVPTPATQAGSTPKPARKSTPKPTPKPTPVPKPTPAPAPAQRVSTATPPAEPASSVDPAREKPPPDPRLAEPGEAAVVTVSEPARSATPSAHEPVHSAAAQFPTGDTGSVASAARGTDAAAAGAGAAPPRSPAPDTWRADLEALLASNKRYPRQARRMRQQGVVTVHARFAADGELLRCEVVASSGFRVLDEAALKLVRNAAEQLRSSRAPGRLAEVRVPIAYELNGRGT